MKMKKIALTLVAIAALLTACSVEEPPTPPTPPANFTFKLTGDPEFQVGENLGLNYYNDITVGVLNYSPDNIKLITASGNETIVMEGKELKNMTSYSSLLKPSIVSDHANKNAIDYNYIGLGQVIQAKDKKIYGLYHGEWHDGTILPGNVPGFYASIGLSVSSDGGLSFSKSAKEVIPNLYDKNFNNGFADGGYGEPSMTFNADSTAVYAYFVDHNRSGKGVNICMAKFTVSPNGTPDFSTCYFLDETNKFTSNVIRPKQIVFGAGGIADAIFPQVTYNKKLKKYLMVYNLNAFQEFSSGQPTQSGIYLRTSLDGINWSEEPQKLISNFAIPFSTTSSFAWHPTLIYSKADQSEGYLLYSKSTKGIAQESHKMVAKKFSIN
jgi:hypothetical protein